MVSHLFTTPIVYQQVPLLAEQVGEVRAYLEELRAKAPGERRSNLGGWHSSSDLFDPARHRQFPFLSEAVTKGLFDYFGSVMGFEGEVSFVLSGWAVINRAGDSNAPHTHPRNLLSGAYYLRVPDGMEGGEIAFMDPRFNANAYGSEAMQRIGLRPPWDTPQVLHAPKQGDLLIFPSWLGHYVNAFRAPDPQAERIVISFNAAV